MGILSFSILLIHHKKILVSECIVSETGICTKFGMGALYLIITYKSLSNFKYLFYLQLKIIIKNFIICIDN